MRCLQQKLWLKNERSELRVQCNLKLGDKQYDKAYRIMQSTIILICIDERLHRFLEKHHERHRGEANLVQNH